MTIQMAKSLLRQFLLLLLLTAGATARAAETPARPALPAISLGSIRECPTGARPAECRPVDLDWVLLDNRETTLVQTVTIRPDAISSSRPLMVWMIATASSEVRWNGVVIGRNGTPAREAAQERPGRFIATFDVPGEVVRPGENLVSVTLSSHHNWLPARKTVHLFTVSFHEFATLPALMAYLPALLALGALAAALLYFGAAAFLDRRDRNALLLAAIAGSTMLQLGAETARAFISYSYPWHLPRLLAIAMLAAVAAVLIATYSARRFAPGWEKATAFIVAGIGLLSLVLPWYDIKALAAIVAGVTAVLICAIRGVRNHVPVARAALSAALLIFGLLIWQRTAFLDQAYYLALSAMLIGLVGEQLLVHRHTRVARDANQAMADVLVREKAELKTVNRQLFDQSRMDPLTKLGTRQKLAEDLEVISSRTGRYSDQYCVIMCDADYFKQYNDTYGHPAGDEVLRKVADVMVKTIRDVDFAYRYGGEEFLVIIPVQIIQEGYAVADRLRAQVEELQIPHSGSPLGVVTISLGVAIRRPGSDVTFAEWLNEADAALYLAKRRGRNRIAIARGPGEADLKLVG